MDTIITSDMHFIITIPFTWYYRNACKGQGYHLANNVTDVNTETHILVPTKTVFIWSAIGAVLWEDLLYIMLPAISLLNHALWTESLPSPHRAFVDHKLSIVTTLVTPFIPNILTSCRTTPEGLPFVGLVLNLLLYLLKLFKKANKNRLMTKSRESLNKQKRKKHFKEIVKQKQNLDHSI